jgi:MSHA pilin protein MshC
MMATTSMPGINRQSGFTLLETVVVIILIGILAVSASSRFIGTDSFDAFAFRSQLIASLRLSQQRAMQHTSGSQCHQYLLTSYQAGSPDLNPCTSNAAFGLTAEQSNDHTRIDIDARYNASLLLADANADGLSSLTFDAWGRPGEDCSMGCKIEVNSLDRLAICIEFEGYIHAIAAGDRCPG